MSNSRTYVFNNRISMKRGKVTEGVRLPDQQSYMAKKEKRLLYSFFRANQSRMTSLLVSALIFFQSFVSILLIFAGVAGRVMRF